MSVFGGPDIVTDGLVLHLDAANRKSYPGSGNTWYDLSGYDHHVTKDSTYQPTYNTNGYFSFTGGQNFETRSANISFGSEITMICWYRQTGAGLAGSAPRLLEISISSATNPSHGNAIVVDTDYSVRGWIDTQGSSYGRLEQLDSISGLTGNIWRMLSYTYAGVSGSSKMYYNGSVQSLIRTVPGTTNDIDDGNNITIGAISDFAVYQHNQHYFVGDISMCHVYNKALSAAEIRKNFEAVKGRFGL